MKAIIELENEDKYATETMTIILEMGNGDTITISETVDDTLTISGKDETGRHKHLYSVGRGTQVEVGVYKHGG